MAFVLLSALTVAVGALAFPPINEHQSSETATHFVSKTHQRHWILLPVSRWGFGFEGSMGCLMDGISGDQTTERRLGPVALVEDLVIMGVKKAEHVKFPPVKIIRF
ncbi:MAG: hypothetical protein QM758_01460 [Armatimonas sp.]